MQTTPTASTNFGVIIYLGALITYLSVANQRGVCFISGVANNGSGEQSVFVANGLDKSQRHNAKNKWITIYKYSMPAIIEIGWLFMADEEWFIQTLLPVGVDVENFWTPGIVYKRCQESD